MEVLLLKEFGVCINEPETTEIFESGWNWLQSLYRVRQRWVPVYFKIVLLLNFQQIKDLKAWEASSRNTSTKQQLFKQQLFEHVMAGWAEKEALEDLATYFTMPTLKIPSNISKQVSEIYAITIFNMFEEEFIESLWYYVSSLNSDG